MQDWYLAEGVHPDDAPNLTALDILRAEEPVIWALIQGYQTSESIAKLILWPHHWVLGTLRRLKEQDLVWDREGRASVIWEPTLGNNHHNLRAWVIQQKRPDGIFRQIDRNDE